MFNKNFYPTPHDVIIQMGIDCRNKVVLEPSAGKGNIIEFLKANGAKEVLACELDSDLAEIIKTKARFIKHDFLKVTDTEISHIDMIVMNPPFSTGVKHLLHAWEIAPAGCQIISLLNADNLSNDHTKERKELKYIIDEYGVTSEIEGAFEAAERKTKVRTALITLFKPGESSREFEGFFMDDDPEERQENGIMQFNFVRDVVQRYVNAVKCFDEHLVVAEKMSGLTSIFDVGSFSFSIGYDDEVCTKEDFKKKMQKKAWTYLFKQMSLEKYVTSGVMKDINTFVENQTKVPFTMKNVYKMFEIIIGTREQTFKRSLVEAVDRFTQHTHENRYHVEGWKTNAGHLINEKFIIPYIVCRSMFGDRIDIARSAYSDDLTDLVKVLCAIEGKNYDDIITLERFFRYRYKLYAGDRFVEHVGEHSHGFDDKLEVIQELQKRALKEDGIKCEIVESGREFGKWEEWAFFRIKCFKKGTMHLQFKDRETWARLNQNYAKIKGAVLPEMIKTHKRNK